MPPSPPYDPRHMARLLASMVPDDIAKSIDSAEFHDRIVEAARLSAQAADGSLSPALRQAAKLRAQAVLRAQPRLATRRQHAELIAKASAARDPRQAEAIRRQADRLIEEQHPMAPRAGAALQKAKASEPAEPVPVFDANGTLIGICDPDDIQPVAGAQATPSAPAAEAGAPVTKGTRLSVWDGYGRRYVTTRAKIRKTDRPRPGVYDDGPLYAVLGHDTGYGTGIAAPEVQARNKGPGNAGGTTGLGQPRRAGQQRALPGDALGRQVIKTGASPAPGRVRTLGEAARERRLARIQKATGQDLTLPHRYARNPFSAGQHCLCEAPAGHATHVQAVPGMPARIAKSSWSPGLANQATEQWLAARRRR
jgi:hypothetical protein